MITKELTIKNEIGLHARPAALFVQTGNKFLSDIMIKKAGKTVNAKSIMGVMAMGISKGEMIEIIIDGPDEENAISAIEDLINVKLLES